MALAPPPGSLGQRLLPSVVDEIARTDPDRLLYSVAKTKDPADGFQDVTYREVARAVDRCAWHLSESLGRADNFPTLVYMGPQDAMYAVLVLASIKSGFKLLLNSPRNSLDAHLSLLDKTDCNVFLLPPNFPLPVVKQILDARPTMRVVEIAPLQHWIADVPYEPYAYNKDFALARLEPFVVLHTSGSTGIPKPVVQTHGTVAPLDAYAALPDQGLPATYPAMCKGKRVYLAFPLFHCAGISMLLPGAIFNGFTVVLGPFPPSAHVANGMHVHAKVEHSCLAPMTLIDLAKDPEYLNNLGLLEQITYGGGPCPEPVGNAISQKTTLLNCLGTTECGVLPVQLCGRDNWSYMSVSPALGREYRHVSGHQYEQIITRRPELDLYQGIFCTFPELEEWPMKDLYTKHPVNEDQWLYRGRTDDIIVFSTGEKINPVDMESIISAHPAVSAALVAGHGYVQSCLLLEAAQPPQNTAGAAQTLDTIWPSVEAANKASPSHGRIHRDMVIFTSPNKPMLRAGKGTVQRKLTVELYEAEIAALYQDAEHHISKTSEQATFNDQAPGDTVKAIISNVTDIDVNSLDANADLFEYGLDSLQVIAIAKQVNSLLTSKGKPAVFEARTVYTHPSLSQLSDHISALFREGQQTGVQELTTKELYERFAADMPITARKPELKGQENFVFLLTGSTGSLGSHILDSLVKEPKVSRVYCLNRGSGSKERQQKSQSDRGLQPLPNDKIVYLDASLAKPFFGLTKKNYKRLLTEVTNVVHNAWPVDFNLSLGSFSNSITAVKRLVKFSVLSRLGAKLFFVSSISTVTEANPVEQRVYRDSNVSQKLGYAQSKFIAEILLDDAAKDAGVSATICRVGQIAGPLSSSGTWPRKEWFPSLIASSKYLGKLPASLGPLNLVDWVPVDVVGSSIVEMTTKATAEENEGATVFHVVNPNLTSWSDLLPLLQQSLGSLEVVSLQEWVSALRESASQVNDISENPALKLVDFFGTLIHENKELPDVHSTAATSVSKSLANLGPIEVSWIKKWLGL